MDETNPSYQVPDPSHAYESLHPAIQEWIWHQRWQQLHAAQALAVAPILAGESDVIISAATATGKTEAAWLPICSALGFDADADRAQSGVKALYISPLKALINDQFDRLQELAATIDLPTFRRHGDVSSGERNALLQQPDGLLLITPEALEAQFVNHGPRLPAMFFGLRYIIIDELHAFIGSERGAQLQSLLHRIELVIRRHVPRIALAATLADTSIAAEFLRPGHGPEVTIVSSPLSDNAEVQLILRGYVATEPGLGDELDTVQQFRDHQQELQLPEDDVGFSDDVEMQAIAANIFKTMRGKDNLVFANSRNNVETYTDILNRLSDEFGVPNEFFAHHGNLSKEHREDVEQKLKSQEMSATAICTSTLELGIDIGSADSIGQIGAPTSVSALRQRLGRSGRRGSPAVMRMYVIEQELNDRTSPIDQLRIQTVQSIATVELLLQRWYEPPNTGSLHLSTLIQQILSMIAQHGGANAAQLFSALCTNGPFVRVNREMFIQLLRDIAQYDFIIQASDGTLLPGVVGEKLINHYSFFTAFQTAREFRLVANGRTLGSIPIEHPIQIGSLLIFAGRRWKVLAIDLGASVIELTRSRGGRPPTFTGGGAEIADGIRRKMREIYQGTDVPAYLSATSQQLLAEGRAAYRRLRLDQSPLFRADNQTLLFIWRGDLIVNTITVALTQAGLAVSQDGPAIECEQTTANRLRTILERLATSPDPDPLSLAKVVANKIRDKYDIYLSAPLLIEAYAARSLDVPGAWNVLRELIVS